MASSDHITATGVWKVTKRDAATGRVLSEHVYKNIIPTVARTAIAKELTGGATYHAAATYVAVGTGGVAPANTDTQLTTELTRKAVAGASNASNVLTVDGFFNETEANGVLTEAAIFGNGNASQATATANSGILYSRVTIAETKSSSETFTLTWSITFS